MLKRTNRHFRYFIRMLSKRVLVYTEMINIFSIIYGSNDYLTYNEEEHPIALQLGGSDRKLLVKCAIMAQNRGYDEVNLNIGCPSIRAQREMFGACLMKHIPIVVDCVKAMRDAITIPVTIKTRIGIDNRDSYEFLQNFISSVSQDGGCETFIIHARKALLSHLSPKKNREIPPLNYRFVYQLKRDFSHLNILINGGIRSLKEVKTHLQYTDGVMIGRAIYQNPRMLIYADQEIFNATTKDSSSNLTSRIRAMYPYIKHELRNGTPLHKITCHIINLFYKSPGANQWRRYLVENANKIGANLNILDNALLLMDKQGIDKN